MDCSAVSVRMYGSVILCDRLACQDHKSLMRHTSIVYKLPLFLFLIVDVNT